MLCQSYGFACRDEEISALVLRERCMNQLKEVLEKLEELIEQHREGGGLSFRYASLLLARVVIGFS